MESISELLETMILSRGRVTVTERTETHEMCILNTNARFTYLMKSFEK